jgi:hypothetical protein
MRLSEAALAGTFLPNRNIGLLSGEPSGGLVDVDCDTIAAQIAATTLPPITPMAHGRTNGRENGRFTHDCYQIEGALPRTEKFQWREEARRRPERADAHETPGADVADTTEPQDTPKTATQTTSIIELRADGC